MTTPSDPNQPGYGQQSGQPGYGQQSGLPNFPAAPPATDAPVETFTPPSEVMGAFWAYLAAAVVILVGALLSLGAKQSLINSLRENNTSNLSDSAINSAATATLTLIVVVGIVVAGLFTLFAFKLRNGRNWARITLAIIAALELINLLVDSGGASILSYVGILAAVVGAVLSFLPKSSAYFSAVKRSRR